MSRCDRDAGEPIESPGVSDPGPLVVATDGAPLSIRSPSESVSYSDLDPDSSEDDLLATIGGGSSEGAAAATRGALRAAFRLATPAAARFLGGAIVESLCNGEPTGPARREFTAHNSSNSLPASDRIPGCDTSLDALLRSAISARADRYYRAFKAGSVV